MTKIINLLKYSLFFIFGCLFMANQPELASEVKGYTETLTYEVKVLLGKEKQKEDNEG